MGRARQLAGRGNNHSILLDSSAADTDVGERLVLNGTDSSSSDAGDNLLTEEGDLIVNEEQEIDTGVKDRLLLERGGVVLAAADRFAFPAGCVVDENEHLV